MTRPPAILMFALSALAAIITISSGCSDMEVRLKEHRSACQTFAKTVVYDTGAWASYVGALKASSTREIQAVAPLNGYSFKFGQGRASMRQIVRSGLKKEDVFVLRGGREIAQLIDYVDLVPRGTYHEGLACTLKYPNLYFRTT